MSDALNLFFGLLLGILAEFWVVYGNIQIKYSHKLDALSAHHVPVYKRLRWWFGFLMYIFNALFKFASYMFASLNVIAPTASISIVMNVAMARWYFKEKLNLKGYIGSGLIIAGCILSIVFGSHSQDEVQLDTLWKYANTVKFILFTSFHITLCVLFGFIGAYFVSFAYHKLHQHKLIPKLQNDIIDIHPNRILSPPHKQQENDDDDIIDILMNDDIDDIDGDEHDEKLIKVIKTPLLNDPINDLLIPPMIHREHSIVSQISTRLLPQTPEKKSEFYHVLTALCLAFSTAGVVAWVQFLGKISADLLWDSVYKGDNQFTSFTPFAIIILISCLLLFELYLISEIMRLFDAVLIIPIFNSLYILTTIGISAAYFKNFKAFGVLHLVFFLSGLVFMFCGMVLLMYAQKHSSMEHQKMDRVNSRTSLLQKS